MKQSLLFTKTRKEALADEEAKNAQLLIRAGYIHKEMAGVYTFLPLGWRVYNNICNIIREEMNHIGGSEIHLSALQDPEVWKQSGRWDSKDVDVWFKTQLQNSTVLGLGFTHEEPLTRMMKNHISSYRDLPSYPYQIQLKFRNEVRSKSGLMRGREFFMKDLYSCSSSVEQHEAFYKKSQEAYMNIFHRVGVGDRTFMTFASGGSFAKYSHEFQTVAEVGEDTIYVSRDKQIAINEEVYTDEVLADLGLSASGLEKVRAVEVGNIFSLGTKFSEAIGLEFTDEDGSVKPVIMGSYGIGPSRLMATIVELLSDEKGIIWNDEVAPYRVHLISIKQDKEAEKVYHHLQEQGIEVLFDDRDVRPGEKFATSDLIGIPHRLTISERSLEQGGLEYKHRTAEEARVLSLEEFQNLL